MWWGPRRRFFYSKLHGLLHLLMLCITCSCWLSVGFDCQLYLLVVVVCCWSSCVGCQALTVYHHCRWWLLLVLGCQLSVVDC
jgi:hypothetical protein